MAKILNLDLSLWDSIQNIFHSFIFANKLSFKVKMWFSSFPSYFVYRLSTSHKKVMSYITVNVLMLRYQKTKLAERMLLLFIVSHLPFACPLIILQTVYKTPNCRYPADTTSYGFRKCDEEEKRRNVSGFV